jgi:hypothetical protein
MLGAQAESTIKAMTVPRYEKTGDVLGTTGEKWGSASAPEVVSEDTARTLIDGSVSLYIYGVVQYMDIFGECHETGFCSQRVLRNTPFILCDNGLGNWFDKKPEASAN